MKTNFYKELIEEYNKRITPLHEKRAELEKELEDLTPSGEDEERYEAKIAVLKRRAEEALAEGKNKAVDQIRAEMNKLKKKAALRNERIEAIRFEIEQLDKEINQIAFTVLNEIYPSIRQRVRDKMNKAIDTIENAWESLQRYERETPAQLKGNHWEGLRFPPIFETEGIRKRLERWL